MTAATKSPPDAPIELELVDVDGPSRRRRVRGARLPAWLAADSTALVWIGIAVATIGFVLIGIAWSFVAGETRVDQQLPYLVSAGMTGLGLIMVGLTIINVTAKRRDATERRHQIDQLVSILGEVQDAQRPSGRRR